MSPLDADFTIYRDVGDDKLCALDKGKLTEKSKQQIKAIVLELIGEDDDGKIGDTYLFAARERNDLRAEQRKKLESL